MPISGEARKYHHIEKPNPSMRAPGITPQPGMPRAWEGTFPYLPSAGTGWAGRESDILEGDTLWPGQKRPSGWYAASPPTLVQPRL